MKNLLLVADDETAEKFKEIQMKLTGELNKNLNQNDTFSIMVERFYQSLT